MEPLTRLDPTRFDTVPILKATTAAARRLAELKGVAATIPNQAMLINTIALQEAKDSSAIENIVTTDDDLFRNAAFPQELTDPAAKEIQRYASALRLGYEGVREQGLLTNTQILAMQTELERHRAGFRKLPGTQLKDATGHTVYVPPQDPQEILTLMSDLEHFINDDRRFAADPLIKMAIIHHQFESIHPFYDGNGRTGRIINVLYLVQRQLLDIPVLYLSRAIVRSKSEYYRLLQAVRDQGAWEEWILYMLRAVEATAGETIETIQGIVKVLMEYKHRIRRDYRFYSQDLVNNLFRHPYTKIGFIMNDLKVTRMTAAKYLDALAADGLLSKHRFGRSAYYVNLGLVKVLTGT